MAVFIVTYDVNETGQDAQRLIDRLEAYGTYWQVQEAVWIISSTHSANAIRENLAEVLSESDKLLVLRLHGGASWAGYGESNTNWLQDRLKPLLRENAEPVS